MKTIIGTLLTVALSASASAQGLLDAICDAAVQSGETATADEYRADPLAHADDFCALARFEPRKAAAQLGKMISTTRARSNPNRHYFDPRLGYGDGYVQLLRPWMIEENRTGAADWTIVRVPVTGHGPLHHQFVIRDELETTIPRRCILVEIWTQGSSYRRADVEPATYGIEIYVSGWGQTSDYEQNPLSITDMYERITDGQYPIANTSCHVW